MIYRLRLLPVVLLVLGSRLSAAEPVVDASAPLETIATEFGLCDGPAWDGVGTLYFPDVKGGKLYTWRPAEKKLTVLLEDAGRISASFYSHGKLYLSDNGSGAISWLNGPQKSVIRAFPGEKPAKPNDLVVDSSGGIYVTLTGQNEVAYITSAGAQSAAVQGIESPNGIILSPDGKRLYVAAYKPKQIWAYDVQGGGIIDNGRVLATMDDGEALGADGMCVDAAGNVYCAGATDIWIWTPEGQLIQRLACPTRPINCTFGDADLKSLYITGFGGLYRQRMKVAGPAVSTAGK
jgi:sugar lactone lactonase YvrE